MNSQKNNRQPLQKGLILSVEEYREADSLCSFLTSEGLETVYARGTQKGSSLNARLLQPFTEAELSFGLQYSGQYLYLFNGRILKSFEKIRDDMDKMAVASVLSWLVIHAPAPQKYYEPLAEIWRLLNSGSPAQWTACCLLVALRFPEEGIVPEVDACVCCGSKKSIAGFSLEQGGLVCREHAEPLDISSRDRLLKIRMLFHARWNNLQALQEKFSFTLDDFCTLCRWYMQLLEVQPAAMRFLLMVHNSPAGTRKDQL